MGNCVWSSSHFTFTIVNSEFLMAFVLVHAVVDYCCCLFFTSNDDGFESLLNLNDKP